MRAGVMILAMLAMTGPAAADTIQLFAAGSLKAALTDVAKAYEAASGNKVEARYGPSGLLKGEISKGTKADVFASANMEHPQALHDERKSGPVSRFARNPNGRTVYGWHITEGRTDIFLTYCTNALAAQKENPGQQIVQLPANLAVGADYGLTVVNEAPATAQQFADFILSPQGEKILMGHGFTPGK